MTRRCKIIPRLLVLAILCSAGTAGAQASTATATILVTATVLSFCTITALPLPFGNYSQAALAATTTVSATCTLGTPYNIGLDPGTGTGGTVAARKMTYLTNTLTYSLYQDSGHSTVWGNTIGTNTVTGTGNGAIQSLTVYGLIPASQLVTPGAYTDTVTATITY
jgi:spore coat protein U-like protein